MKHAHPLFVCCDNEDFRSLLRSMLEKHGYFHVLEAQDSKETEDLFARHPQPLLTLIHVDLLGPELYRRLADLRHFIVIGPADDEKMTLASVRLGVQHFLSFPFSSRGLKAKIDSVL